MELQQRSRSNRLDKDLVNINVDRSMSADRQHRLHLKKTEYSPIGSSGKLNLLLQRSLRYSYRQRCCNCFPTILCELLFPLIIIGLLALTRYGTNALIRDTNEI